MSTQFEENPYRAPEARVEDAFVGEATQQFYVVSPRKFLILMIGTLNLYQLYWFYKHWSQLNNKHKSYWPVLRAIFAIFFTHSLFAEIDRALLRISAPFRWMPMLLATIYVVTAIFSAVAGQVLELVNRNGEAQRNTVVFGILGILMSAMVVWALYRAQRAANVADGDPEGTSNASITGANVAWLVFGGLMWLVNVVAWYSIFTGQAIG